MSVIALDISQPSTFMAVVGFYIVFIGLFSYVVKERLYISDSMLSLAIGIIVGPICANWVSPWQWTLGNDDVRNNITYEIVRIVIGIQVLFCGINLPRAYLAKCWKSLSILIIPVLTVSWLLSAALVYALIPKLTFLECLVIGACVAPTDPILANAIVKGRYAENHVPEHVRDLLAAESAMNDGLGFPFIFLAIYLMRSKVENYSTGEAIWKWLLGTVLYEIVLSVIMGIVIGIIARKSLKYAERNKLINHESFLAYGIGLVFFTLGVQGLLGTDDLLSCFIVGNVFTWTPWDDWFRKETEDHSFQHVIDQLINSAVFIYIGTIMPWSDFGDVANGLTPGRLVAVTILILLLRRLPITLLLKTFMPDLRNWKEAAFAGWFGPIGVSAIYYAQVALRELPEQRTGLLSTVVPIVYMIVLGSVCVHGISIPLIKHPRAIARTYSRSMTLQLGSRTTTMNKEITIKAGANDLPNRQTVAVNQPVATMPEEVNRSSLDVGTSGTFALVVEQDDQAPHANRQAGDPDSMNLLSPGHSQLSVSGYTTPQYQSSRAASIASNSEGNQSAGGGVHWATPLPEMEVETVAP